MKEGSLVVGKAGRDAAEMGTSECIVDILSRLVVYVKTIVNSSLLCMPLCGQQASVRKDLATLRLSEVLLTGRRLLTSIPHE